MDPQETLLERVVLGVAHALFLNRLHVLRLTEVVRLGIKPDSEGIMNLPPDLDNEMKAQAADYVLTFVPSEFSVAIHRAKADWMRPA